MVLALGPLGVMGVFAIKTAEELILNLARNQVEHVAQDKAVLLERWIAERQIDLEVEDFRIAMDQIRRMEATINRCLDFAKPQEPVFFLISVDDLMEEALLIIGPRARQQETILQKSIQNPRPKLREQEMASAIGVPPTAGGYAPISD